LGDGVICRSGSSHVKGPTSSYHQPTTDHRCGLFCVFSWCGFYKNGLCFHGAGMGVRNVVSMELPSSRLGFVGLFTVSLVSMVPRQASDLVGPVSWVFVRLVEILFSVSMGSKRSYVLAGPGQCGFWKGAPMELIILPFHGAGIVGFFAQCLPIRFSFEKGFCFRGASVLGFLQKPFFGWNRCHRFHHETVLGRKPWVLGTERSLPSLVGLGSR